MKKRAKKPTFKGTVIHLRLTGALAERLESAVQLTGRDRPDILREALFKWLEANKIRD